MLIEEHDDSYLILGDTGLLKSRKGVIKKLYLDKGEKEVKDEPVSYLSLTFKTARDFWQISAMESKNTLLRMHSIRFPQQSPK